MKVLSTILMVCACTLCFTTICAQSPGGVPAAAWWKASSTGTVYKDAGTTPAGDGDQVHQ